MSVCSMDKKLTGGSVTVGAVFQTKVLEILSELVELVKTEKYQPDVNLSCNAIWKVSD